MSQTGLFQSHYFSALVISITSSAGDGSGLVRDYCSMLSGQSGLILEIKCPCARKTWHEREVGVVGVFLKWTYFRETTVCTPDIYVAIRFT